MSDRMTLSERHGMKVSFIPQNDGTFLIGYAEDVEPHLNHNKALVSNDDFHKRRKMDMWHAAHIPTTVIMKWLLEDGIDVFNPEHDDRVNAKLNSNEWRYLRTSEFII
jgi:ureidoglycolate hydrolase